jgi:hypothetical protein
VHAVKFRNVVRPGQILQLRFESPSPGSVRFAIESTGESVADGTVSFTPAAVGAG